MTGHHAYTAYRRSGNFSLEFNFRKREIKIQRNLKTLHFSYYTVCYFTHLFYTYTRTQYMYIYMYTLHTCTVYIHHMMYHKQYKCGQAG